MSTASRPFTGLRFLRSYLYKDVSIANRQAYLRFHSISASRTSSEAPQSVSATGDSRALIQRRIDQLKLGECLEYPRVQTSESDMTCLEFRSKYKFLLEPERAAPEDLATVTLHGRLLSFRVASKALFFMDIVHDQVQLQVVCERKSMNQSDFNQIHSFLGLLQRGDIISVQGKAYVTSRDELSIRCSSLPTRLSPSLAILPRKLEDRETRVRNRHVDMLVNKSVADTLRVRSYIIQHMREYLRKDDFLEVQTPLIVDKASGAIARPFTTVATEFSGKQLALRIAPEIWLKRLVIGGMDRVFEIGPAFRNEGLDASHNPEFTTCEFYKSYADLETLMSMTEELFTGIAARVSSLREESLKTLPEVSPELISTPFKRISFIPAIESALGTKLPDLSQELATEQVIELFRKHSITLPSSPTLPKLLDKLASVYIEPLCGSPTFITHHPTCMAPLSKSFFDAESQQHVSARAELFIRNQEIANMYEEENSPFEQRRKFLQQLEFKDSMESEESAAASADGVDESYLDALETGLPPTGGWGAGVDRIVMLFSGQTRIGDVLTFGSLRNVVNLGNRGSPRPPVAEAPKA